MYICTFFCESVIFLFWTNSLSVVKTCLLLVTEWVCVFSDLTDSSSFQRARFWVKELQNCEEVSELLCSSFLCCITLQNWNLNKRVWFKLFHCTFIVFVLQQCKIYLCGTKNDLISADRSLRQIDYHDAQDFAEGNYSLCLSLNWYKVNGCFLGVCWGRPFNKIKTPLCFSDGARCCHAVFVKPYPSTED